MRVEEYTRMILRTFPAIACAVWLVAVPQAIADEQEADEQTADGTEAASEDAAPEATSPQVVQLEVFPASLSLTSSRDSRRVIVSGVLADGLKTDLSGSMELESATPCCTVSEDGFVTPVEAGSGTVIVRAGGLETTIAVEVAALQPTPVDFASEINPLLSKVGCNQGTCHGSQAGKNGFKLSLRGYDPLYDYSALIDDVSGRRFNRAQPSQSLMLLKPTQGVPHEGGFLFDEKSLAYALIQQWIEEGCHFNPTPPQVTGIEVFPKTPLLQKRGDTQQLIVLATFDNGTTRDVTRDAVFDTSSFEVATVSKTGRVKAVRRGEAAALVRYEGNYASAPVTILGNRDGFEWSPAPEFNFVDKLVNDKLERMQILPSELCSDEEFLRRVYLDLTGVPPTIEQIQAFVADTRPVQDKRTEVVDHLLASPDFVEFWTLKWSDLLLARRKAITEKGVWAFRNWIRNSLAENKPYDQFAYELITANGSTFENPAANYYRIAREPKVVMENMTQVFLGTRFNCNQCHDHPFERWTQDQYYQLSAYFADVGRAPADNDEEIIYTRGTPEAVIHAGTGQASSPEFPFVHEGNIAADATLREQLAQWLVAPENGYFARSVVNRYWSYFLGVGIIDPVDDIRASNPASNPELLKAMTERFIESGFDMRQMMRTIVTSHTYQRSFRPNEWNEDDRINFSHAMPRRLTAEQLYDAIIHATGAPRELPGVPKGFRAAQLPDSQTQVSFLDMFGRAPRESPCECERTSDVSLGQTLNLVNGPTIGNAISHPEGIIARTIAAGASNEQLIETVYLSALARRPSPEELKREVAYFAEVGNAREASEDLMWALLNSPAFLFNR